MQKVYVVAGPTGVGKTEFSIKLAKKLGGEIINGDAYQIYRGLDIGTAKITEQEMDGVPHHLFDIFDACEECSVFDYQKLARDKILEISSRNKVPIIVGGSGYYLKTILYDYKFNKQENMDFSAYTNDELYEMLLKMDAKRAEKLHPNNRIRVERALQSPNISPIGDLLYDAVIITITMDRETLYSRINKRVDLMIENGLLNEINSLIENGVTFDMQSTKAIGYKEFKDYFKSNKTLEEVIIEIKKNSRRYAKKQYTWFRNQMDVEWVLKDDLDEYLEKLTSKKHTSLK